MGYISYHIMEGIYIKILIDILFLVYFCTNCYFKIDNLEFMSF